MENLTAQYFAEITDLACVKAETEMNEIIRMAELANKWGFTGVYALPSHNRTLKQLLKDNKKTFIGGAVGFPSGGTTTSIKIKETEELISDGCGEIDMVVNISWLKAKMYDEFKNDIKSVVNAAGGKVVKAIIEVHYLTDREIETASKLASDSGVSFIKTATGWAGTGASFDNVKIIAEALKGTACGIKAAGGIKDAETARKMIDIGVTRFGCSLNSAENIILSL